MTPADVRARAAAARKFLEVADMVRDDVSDPALSRVAGSLAALAGIAASDAICGSVLGQRSQGQDHGQAVEVLASIRDARPLASALRRLLADKANSEYGTTFLSPTRAGDMVEQARVLVDGMDEMLRKGPA